MQKNILIISSSPRKGGNSETMAEEFAKGAKEAKNFYRKLCFREQIICFCHKSVAFM